MSLREKDLKGMVLPTVSVDEFEPKAGNTKEVIVVGFYVKNLDAANDLNTFIQRGTEDIIDVEVSPSTDEDGNYVVFVEYKRSNEFEDQLYLLLKDVENLTGKTEWVIKPYLSEQSFSIDDENLFASIITDPDSYIDKKQFQDSLKESASFLRQVEMQFRHSGVNNVRLTESSNSVTFNSKLAFNIYRASADSVLKESDTVELYRSAEVRYLEESLGSAWLVMPYKNSVVVSKDNFVCKLTNLEFVYE